MWQKLFFLAVAGACGTLARYGLSGLVQRVAGTGFPWGTVSVNALGCLLFGLVWTLTSERFPGTGELRIVLLTGFLGAFTTFSTYMAETGNLLADGEQMYAIGNILLQNGVGVVLFFVGMALGRLI
ncbi:fluoride efflux transporter FluC [Thiovibrio frasassiensis]|uniref:Fluoride-specific ion channel FluC n=1 Tax=Thiovibrio frasassiensis TaxID=2984131 RepID=A0A9X4MLL9_9BACT|nr:CrcB family protein [Thiovibrio frasassiensis]MDG4477064.1 CrcB family protein [Thiovibrio frasassiensis]